MTKENAPSLLRRSLELSVFRDTTTIVRSFYICISLSREVTISVKTKDIFFFPSLRFDSIGFEAIGETG